MNTVQQKNCIFCKIIQGEIPCFPISNTDTFIVFLDINPVNKGHLLLVPKIHAETIFELPTTVASELLTSMKSIGSALIKSMNAHGLNIFQNNYPVAGQEVPHVHWHLIPRFTGDKHIQWIRGKYTSNQEMTDITNKITSVLTHESP